MNKFQVCLKEAVIVSTPDLLLFCPILSYPVRSSTREHPSLRPTSLRVISKKWGWKDEGFSLKPKFLQTYWLGSTDLPPEGRTRFMSDINVSSNTTGRQRWSISDPVLEEALV